MCGTNQFNRVYSQVPGTTFANPTNIGYFPATDTYAIVAAPTGGATAVSNLAGQNPVFPASTVSAIRNNCVQVGGQTSANMSAVVPARQPGGALVNVRREAPSEKAFTGMVLTLSVVNAASGGALAILPIGDFCKAYELGASLAAIPAGVTIGGTAGANTLAYIKARSGTVPFRVNGIQFVASATSFFAQGKFAYIKTYPDLTNTQSQFNLSSLQNSYDNNPLVQQLDTTEIVASNTLYLLTVPNGITVTLNIGIKSEVDANDYRLING